MTEEDGEVGDKRVNERTSSISVVYRSVGQ